MPNRESSLTHLSLLKKKFEDEYKKVLNIH